MCGVGDGQGCECDRQACRTAHHRLVDTMVLPEVSISIPLCLAQGFLIQRSAVPELFGAAFSLKMAF